MSSPRLSASVILYRENPSLEVFWVRRSPHMFYQGGFHAFPGGQLDPGEDVRAGAVRELEEETGARVDRSRLADVGRWVTPPFLPRRFDTQFFLARCPESETPQILTGEHDFGQWIEPASAIREWREGLVLMAPPIRHALLCLSEGLATRDLAGTIRVEREFAEDECVELDGDPGWRLRVVHTPGHAKLCELDQSHDCGAAVGFIAK